MWIDSHCHLDLTARDLQCAVTQLVSEARAVGVEGMLTVSVDLADFENLCAIASQFSAVWASVGVHPNEPGAKGAGTIAAGSAGQPPFCG